MAKSGMTTRRRRRAKRPGPPVFTYIEGEKLARNKTSGFAYFHLPDEHGIKKRFYQGRFDDPATVERAGRFIREYRAAGGPLQKAITVRQLADRYMEFAREHYGAGSSRIPHFTVAVDFLCDRYGNLAATAFGPLKLLAVRDAMVESGRWVRGGVNERMSILKRTFKWAASRELIPATVPNALGTVENIARGRTAAREGKKVRPAPEAHIKATLAFLSAVVRAMVEVQRLTGMRPGELVIMQPCDIEREGKVWIYSPAHHKTEHLDHEHVVAIGPKSQKVLAPFLLGRKADAGLFSPKESEAERRAKLREARVTPLEQGNAPGTNKKRRPMREPGDHYTVASYRHAIERACKKAEVPVWRPHQLRHNRATELRRKYGIEAARIALGHKDAGVTQIYAEADLEMARKIAAEMG